MITVPQMVAPVTMPLVQLANEANLANYLLYVMEWLWLN